MLEISAVSLNVATEYRYLHRQYRPGLFEQRGRGIRTLEPDIQAYPFLC